MSDQDDFDKVFASISMTSVVEDVDQVVSQVLHLESLARHAMACEGDHETAGEVSQQAYEVFSNIPYRSLPTFIMAMADRYNQEREALHALLDVVYEARVKLGAISTSGLPFVQAFQLVDVVEMLKKGIEDSPYSRKEDSE